MKFFLKNSNFFSSELEMMTQPASAHRLAVLIPFRNTFDELQQFVPYMSQFLTNQSVPHEFFVINQVMKRNTIYLLITDIKFESYCLG